MVSVPSGQLIYLFFRDIGNGKKVEKFPFSITQRYRKMEKKSRYFHLPVSRKNGKVRDFFHFSDARGNRKRSRNFHLFVTQ